MRRSGRVAASSALVAALGLTVLLTATSGEGGSGLAWVLGPATALLGFLWLGRMAGWRSILAVTSCVVLVGFTASAIFYDHQNDVPSDARVSGMDEIGRDPGSVTILLPAIWFVLLIGMAMRGRPDEPSSVDSRRLLPVMKRADDRPPD